MLCFSLFTHVYCKINNTELLTHKEKAPAAPSQAPTSLVSILRVFTAHMLTPVVTILYLSSLISSPGALDISLQQYGIRCQHVLGHLLRSFQFLTVEVVEQ